MQFDLKVKMDYYMPRFFLRLGCVASSLRVVDRVFDGPLHTEFHANYLAVDPPS
jgi:hypothetical protein